MLVVSSGHHVSVIHLLADDRVCHPRLFQNLTHPSTSFGIDVQHAMNDVPTFSGEQTKNSPRTSDDLLFVGCNVDAGDWELFLLGWRGISRILPLVRVVVVSRRAVVR